MKEAFWGALIVILGLFGIVVINIFQNVTVDNDRVYYLIKESTEAAAFDALDLTYYRLTGDLRIVEDKFVENLTRRFAENVTAGDYIIVVEDINEVPPKVSLRIRSGVTSLQGQEFGIVNRVDGILETKYGLDEVLDFLDITKEEEGDENICDLGGLEKEDMECIPGDLMFSGFGDENINDTVCDDEQDKLPKNVQREARYKVCNCGKWEEKSEVVTANPVKNGNEWIYTWTFTKVGDLRTITETARKRVLVQICTKAIGVMVPNDIEKTVPKKDGTSYEPSTDNSKYMACPVDGIRIPYGMKFTLHPNYIPPESVNRDIKWTVSDSSILSIQSSNPLKSCELNSKGTNCYSKAIVTANTQKEGTVIVNISNTRGQSATCKIEVFDGTIDDVSCKDISVKVNSSEIISYEYMPKNATNYDFEFTISDSSMATVSGNKITGKKNGTTTITVKDKVTGKSGTCKLMVASPASGSSSSMGSSDGGSYWLVEVPYYNTSEGTLTGYKAFSSYDEAMKWAAKTSNNEGKKELTIYNVSSSGGTTKNSSVSCGSQTCNKTNPNGIHSAVKNPNYTPPPPSPPRNDSSSSNSWWTPSYSNPIVSMPPMYCFLKGTKVATEKGYKDIDKIEVGDVVLSYNIETGKNEYKKVTKVFYHPNQQDTLYSIAINGKVVEASSAHKFFIKTSDGFDWISAKDLEIGDIVKDSDGNYLSITNITSKPILDDLYNIEVEENHNYYVTESEILVHNRK